jgi:hypothetical protein
MQRKGPFFLGLAITLTAVILRLNVGKGLFTSFGWGGPLEISRDFLNMHAWIDLFNIAILTGLALTLIGWFVPPSSQD